MPVIDTFSKRKARAERAGVADVYQYDVLPDPLRQRIVRILQKTIGLKRSGRDGYSAATAIWDWLCEAMAQELGRSILVEGAGTSPSSQCCQFILTEATLLVLDLVELAFQRIEASCTGWYDGTREAAGATQLADDALDEINIRFREHGVGYQFEGGQIIALNSEYLHSEAVVPAIQLLHDAAFAGASQEFLSAHRHYREGHHKEAMVDALKAFESTMKTICDARGWAYDPSVTSQRLIDIVFQHGLLPAELTSHFTALRSLLESGVPTLRNRKAAHGQGAKEVTVPDYLAAHALHLTASNIVLLVTAHEALN